MSKEYQKYETAIQPIISIDGDPRAKWMHFFDWYKEDGRQQFVEAFKKETNITISNNPNSDEIVGAAIPKSIGDLENKVSNDAYYRAHATWFLQELDHITARVPRDVAETDQLAAMSLKEVLLFVRPLMFDSRLLFEDWASYKAGVPGVFGVGKNIAEHMMAFFQGARQTIYGHGAFGLSFVDNHADLATATIRQAVEIRLRRAFGIMGKTRKSDDSFHPIALSNMLDAIDVHKDKVAFPVRFENIKRINGWSNLYLHGGLKLYAWSAPRVLEFLRVFLIGNTSIGSRAGVECDEATFQAIREIVQKQHETEDFEVEILDIKHCELIIRN